MIKFTIFKNTMNIICNRTYKGTRKLKYVLIPLVDRYDPLRKYFDEIIIVHRRKNVRRNLTMYIRNKRG